jgi:hypothetical protein
MIRRPSQGRIARQMLADGARAWDQTLYADSMTVELGQCDSRQHTELVWKSSSVTPPKSHSPRRLCP